MKAYGGVEVEFQSFLNSTLDGMNGQLHASPALPPEERNRCTH
jgi:hypothetical protein